LPGVCFLNCQGNCNRDSKRKKSVDFFYGVRFLGDAAGISDCSAFKAVWIPEKLFSDMKKQEPALF